MESRPEGRLASATIEALLFAAGTPLTIERLAAVLGAPTPEVERAVDRLSDDLDGRGIRVVRNGGEVELATSPDLAPIVRRLSDEAKRTKLSHAALETLAIAAYRQPVTRPQIEAIRGVSSERPIATLLSHDLLEEAGRLETAGRPVQYRTTMTFLERFGLRSLDELPPLTTAEARELLRRDEAAAPVSPARPPIAD